MARTYRIPYSEQLWRRNVQSQDAIRLIMYAIARCRYPKNVEVLRYIRASRDFRRFAAAIHPDLPEIIELRCKGALPYVIEQYIPEGREITEAINEDEEIERLKNLYIQYLATRIVALGYPDNTRINEFRSKVGEVLRVGAANLRDEAVGESLEEALLEDSVVLWPSKYPTLNELLNGGIKTKRLYTFGGASGVGKSILLLNLYEDALKNEVPSLLISLENTLQETKKRLVSLWTRTPLQRLTPKILQDPLFKKKLKEIELYSQYGRIIEASSLTLKDIINLITNSEVKPQAVFLDYLNLVSHSPYRNRAEDLEDLTKSLRDFAAQSEISLFSACQLNRTALAMDDPDESSVGESYGIVKASDLFATIYYDRKTYNRRNITHNGYIYITKSRISPKERIKVAITPSEMSIIESLEE